MSQYLEIFNLRDMLLLMTNRTCICDFNWHQDR